MASFTGERQTELCDFITSVLDVIFLQQEAANNEFLIDGQMLVKNALFDLIESHIALRFTR